MANNSNIISNDELEALCELLDSMPTEIDMWKKIKYKICYSIEQTHICDSHGYKLYNTLQSILKEFEHDKQQS